MNTLQRFGILLKRIAAGDAISPLIEYLLPALKTHRRAKLPEDQEASRQC